jgi:lysophospholipase L1-like esterase
MGLAADMRQRGIPLADPRIIAVTGWTTDELSAAMNRADLKPQWGLVSLLIGVNNQYRGRDLENYRQEYTALLDRAIALAGGRTDRVVVLSIPDWSASPFGQGSGRDLAEQAAGMIAYNQAKREITESRGVAWFDITPSTLEMRDDKSLVAHDGLHPSAKLYARWVKQIAEPVSALLTQ